MPDLHRVVIFRNTKIMVIVALTIISATISIIRLIIELIYIKHLKITLGYSKW